MKLEICAALMMCMGFYDNTKWFLAIAIAAYLGYAWLLKLQTRLTDKAIDLID